MTATLFTVGHGTRSIDDFIHVLHSAQIGRVIDVRRYPASRRNPQFGGDALAASLERVSIAYDRRGEELGGRRRTVPDSPNTALRNDAFRGYADYMRSDDFGRALERLQRDARRERVAIMCAERLWWRCHRRMIADALVARGTNVVHLLDADTSHHHDPMPAMRLDDSGRPVYDVGATPSLLR